MVFLTIIINVIKVITIVFFFIFKVLFIIDFKSCSSRKEYPNLVKIFTQPEGEDKIDMMQYKIVDKPDSSKSHKRNWDESIDLLEDVSDDDISNYNKEMEDEILGDDEPAFEMMES
jgi:hypothetical protein